MSSSLGSASSWSSCRWRRSSSPDSFAPPSSDMFLKLASRSRRRRSASAGIAEEPQYPAEVGPQPGSLDDRVEMAETEVGLGEPEVLGQLLSGRLLNDPRAGERDQCSRLGDRHVSETREAREHAGRGRMGEDV